MEITALFAIDAEELLDQGKIEEAIELCLKGLEAFPDYPSGKIVLARAYKMSGQEELVEESFQKVMEARPNFKMLKSIKEKNFEVPKAKVIEEPELEENNSDDDKDLVSVESINNISVELIGEDIVNDEAIIEENNSSEDLLLDEVTEIEDSEQTEKSIENAEIETIESEIDDQLKEIEAKKEEILSTEVIGEPGESNQEFDLKDAFDKLDKQIEEIEINSKDINLISGLKSIPKINVSLREIDKPKISRIKLPEIATPDIIKKKTLNGDKDFLQMSLRNIREEGALEELGLKTSAENSNTEIPVTIVSEEYDYEVFTETIANIYIQQGAIKKAKEVFEKLISLEPEKADYYKERIKNL